MYSTKIDTPIMPEAFAVPIALTSSSRKAEEMSSPIPAIRVKQKHENFIQSKYLCLYFWVF